jgi:hypothetical protein
MERLIGELLGYCLQNPSVGGMAVWGAFVTIVVWAPYFLPQRLAGFAWHLFGYGMFGIFAERLIRLTTSPQPYLPLLEVTALGLTAIFVWLETMKRKREMTERKLPLLQDQYHDWMNAVRLALWATLLLMPVVRWV